MPTLILLSDGRRGPPQRPSLPASCVAAGGAGHHRRGADYGQYRTRTRKSEGRDGRLLAETQKRQLKIPLPVIDLGGADPYRTSAFRHPASGGSEGYGSVVSTYELGPEVCAIDRVLDCVDIFYTSSRAPAAPAPGPPPASGPAGP